MFVSPAFASPSVRSSGSVSQLHMSTVNSVARALAPGFDPNSAVGGIPFCSSGGLGTIVCYTPPYLKAAYNFPSGFDGTGSTIVIVDAFGSPTIQSDLNKFDSTFGLPAGSVTVLCGPTWTGSPSDQCPVNTISDLNTAPYAALCGATGWAEETTLDVTMAHGLAPNAHIVLVVANDCFDSSIYTAEQAVVNQHKYDGSIMSQSFGEPDDLVTCTTLDPTGSFCTNFDPTLLNQPNHVFQTAFEHRWTVIASSGDCGANTDACVLGSVELTPSFPSTSPLVLAAGGTQGLPYGGDYSGPPGPGGTFSCAAGATCNTGLVIINGGANGCGTAARPGEPSSCYPVGYGGEGAWNEWTSLGAGTQTGGGVSILYSQPAYQVHTPSSWTTLLGDSVQVTGRTVPDVSFNAAVYGGFIAFCGFAGPSGTWFVFGGTSASSPAWAGIMALLNQAGGKPAGFVNTQIYHIGGQMAVGHGPGSTGAPFHDITFGNNSITAGDFGIDGFTSAPGYDLTTGWGTPSVSGFIQAMLHVGA